MKTLFMQIGYLFLSITLLAQDQLTNNGNLRLFSGASLCFFGDFANIGTFTDGGQGVIFSGSSPQTISGQSAFTINNLVLNNLSGITMEQSLYINNSLVLTFGALNLNSNTVTIDNGITSSLTRTSGYIVSEQTDNSGKLIWNIGSNTGSYLFPFGTASGAFIPFALDITGGDIGNVSVSTYPTIADNTPYPVSPVLVSNMNDADGNDNSANVVDRFWQIDKDGPGGMATLTFTATSSEVGGISDLAAQRWNSSVNGWEAPPPNQTNTTTSVTIPGVTNFSPWALVRSSTPLPIELLSFDAKRKKSKVDIFWETSSEINNEYFTVEKSKDCFQFEKVVIVKGAGNSSQTLCYFTTDNSPYGGVSYYRLRQTDFDGRSSFSKIAQVNFAQIEALSLNLFPNPASSKVMISVSGIPGEQLLMRIVDFSGKQFYSEILVLENNNFDIELDIGNLLVSGEYYVIISNKERNVFSRFVVNK